MKREIRSRESENRRKVTETETVIKEKEAAKKGKKRAVLSIYRYI